MHTPGILLHCDYNDTLQHTCIMEPTTDLSFFFCGQKAAAPCERTLTLWLASPAKQKRRKERAAVAKTPVDKRKDCEICLVKDCILFLHHILDVKNDILLPQAENFSLFMPNYNMRT